MFFPLQEVKVLRDEMGMEESRAHYLNAMRKILELQQAKVADEMKLYVSSDPHEKKKSLRSVFCLILFLFVTLDAMMM
jgi:intraflagellar transport protein 81